MGGQVISYMVKMQVIIMLVTVIVIIITHFCIQRLLSFLAREKMRMIQNWRRKKRRIRLIRAIFLR